MLRTMFLALFGLIFLQGAGAREATLPTRYLFDEWIMTCGDITVRTSCFVSLDVVGIDDGRVWLKAIARVDNEGRWQVTFTVPPQAHARQTISLRGDRATKEFLHHQCSTFACKAVWDLSPADKENLLLDYLLAVEYGASEREGTRLLLRLRGLKAAIALLDP